MARTGGSEAELQSPLFLQQLRNLAALTDLHCTDSAPAVASAAVTAATAAAPAALIVVILVVVGVGVLVFASAADFRVNHFIYFAVVAVVISRVEVILRRPTSAQDRHRRAIVPALLLQLRLPTVLHVLMLLLLLLRWKVLLAPLLLLLWLRWLAVELLSNAPRQPRVGSNCRSARVLYCLVVIVALYLCRDNHRRRRSGVAHASPRSVLSS